MSSATNVGEKTPGLPPEKSRRDFITSALKTATFLITSSALLSTKEDPLYATAGNCDITQEKFAQNWTPSVGQLVTWMNGLMFNKSNLKQNGQFAAYFSFLDPQIVVEKAVIVDSQENILAARRFPPSTFGANSAARNPYLIFQNLPILNFTSISLILQTRSPKAGRQVFRRTYPIATLTSRTWILNGEGLLPPQLQLDLQQSFNNQYSTPFYIPNPTAYSKNSHALVAQWVSVDPQSDQFKIQIWFMHKDISADHYMRYFVVTDPVGRILGITKRNYSNLSTDTAVMVSALTTSDLASWRITPDQVARISQCPYVMIFADDVAESLSCTILRLS